jgi:hypothetical protein
MGPLGRGMERMVRDDGVEKARGLPPDRREVHVDHMVKHPLLRDLGIADLNLIRLCKGRPGGTNQDQCWTASKYAGEHVLLSGAQLTFDIGSKTDS